MALTRALVGAALCAFVGCGEPSGDTPATCGDGQLDATESCDDGNAFPGDGCSAQCALEEGYSCMIPGISCASVCGDGVLVGDEACDDGNTASGDGCSSICEVEEPGSEVCVGGEDEDGDGAIDCDDPDCAEALECAAAETEGDCADGVDNDEDGATDCADADCDGDPACDEPPPAETDCVDGADNDEDGTTDCDDADCVNAPECQQAEICGNGVDDDDDGLADCLDPDCADLCEEGECGDGELNAGEECDDGDANSDTEPDACRTACRLPSCGDAVVDAGEACDGGEACTDACQLDPCVGEGSVEFLADQGVPVGAGFEYRLSLGLDDGDERLPVCAAELGLETGYDAAVVFEPPSSGTWLLDTSRRGTNIGVWVSVGTSCLDDDQLACSGTNGEVNRGALLVELDEGVPYTISLDAAPDSQGVVLLELFPVAEVVGEGDMCTPGLFERFCEVGLECVSGVCEPREGDFAGVGEACGVGDMGVVPCAPGLECVEEVCAVTAGATCDNAVDLNAIGEAFDGGLEATLADFASPSIESTCGTAGFDGKWVRYTPSAAAWVSLDARSTDGDPFVFVAVKESCGGSFSDFTCDSTAFGTARAELTASASTPLVGFVAAESEVELTVRETPIAGETERCDPDGVLSRCGPGLFCNGIGRCEMAGYASCIEPVLLLDEGVGDIAGTRGLTLFVDTTGTTDASDASCTVGAAQDFVIEMVAPQTGRYAFSTGPLAEGGSISIRRSCDFPSTEWACEAVESGAASVSVEVRAGARLFVVFEPSQRNLTTSLSARLTSLVDVGGECLASVDCLSELQCAEGVCTPRSLGAGESCRDDFASACGEGLYCDATVCRPQVSIGEECPFGADAPCETGLVCASVEGGGLCVAPNGGLDAVCVPDGPPCAIGLDCRGYTDTGVGACALTPAFGEICRPDEPGALCLRGLACNATAAGSGEWRCGFPADTVALGDSCAENINCEEGSRCAPIEPSTGPADDALCRPLLESGATCTEDLDEGVCPFGESCEDVGGALRCVLAGSCASSVDCAPDDRCAEGVCVPRSVEGEVCDLSGEPDQCVAGLICRDDATDGIACWMPETGGGCTFSFDCPSETEYCNAARVCAERLAEGADCDPTDSADQCTAPLSCREGGAGPVCAP